MMYVHVQENNLVTGWGVAYHILVKYSAHDTASLSLLLPQFSQFGLS